MALASPYPDVEIPDLSVPEFVLAAGRERPDAPALIDGLKGDMITHGQLAAYVDRVAANLHARGLRKGDVVAVFCPNTPWYPVVFHGIAAAGCVMSPINSLYTPDEIAFQLKDSGAKILITISLFMDRAAAAAEQAPVDEIDRPRRRARATPTCSTCSAPRPRRCRSTSTRPTTWSRCPTPAARPACPRA